MTLLFICVGGTGDTPNGWLPFVPAIVITQLCCAGFYPFCNSGCRIKKVADVTYLEVPTDSDITGDVVTCQYSWSPDGLFVAFAALCWPPAAGYRNAYLVSLKNGQVTEIVPNGDRANTAMRLVWYDAYDLLISALYYGVTTRMETYLYNTSTNLKTLLASSWITEAALNPVSGVLSFRYSSATQQAADYSHDIFLRTAIQSGVIKAGQFAIENVVAGTDSIGENQGCALWWSPDGVYLATSISSDCDNGDPLTNVIGYAFLKNGMAPVVQRLFTVDGYPANVAVGTTIGWTVAPGINNPTLIPFTTLTPLPTSTPPGSGASVPGSNQIGG